MSLKESLFTNIDSIINNYIDAISSKYTIDKNELQQLWGNKANSTVLVSSLSNTTDLSHDRLLKSTKAELIALCKKHGCKCSGTKAILISRLLGNEEESTDKSKPKPKPKKKTEEKKVDPSSTRILKKVLANKPSLCIRRNQFGNYEHPETHLVFVDKQVVGRQNENGDIDELSKEDIQSCNKFKFSYKLPDNIVSNKVYQEAEEVEEKEESEEEVEEVEESEEEEEEVAVEESEEEVELESDSEEEVELESDSEDEE